MLFDFGVHLKTLRKSHGFTQKQLACMLHTSVNTVVRWESNYKLPSFESLERMAKIYNVPLNYLAGVDKKRSVCIDHLSDTQVGILRSLILEFQSASFSRAESVGLTQRQQDILSNILLEFKNSR